MIADTIAGSGGYLRWEDRYGVQDWERRSMTICIAAICDMGRSIVIAADREVGLGFTSTDFAGGKFRALYSNWVAGLAGHVTNASEVLGLAKRRKDKMPSLASYDVAAEVQRAYGSVRLEKAEALYLLSRGWTLDEFRKTGATRLPPSTYADIDARISQYDLGTDLLLVGFADDGPSIITIRNPGVMSDQSILSFWCVGSGSTAAQMSLFAREYSMRVTLEAAAYYLYEAKRVAELATGVGDKTDLYLLKKGKQGIRIEDGTLKELATIYDKLKPREFSKVHKDKLAECDEFRVAKTI